MTRMAGDMIISDSLKLLVSIPKIIPAVTPHINPKNILSSVSITECQNDNVVTSRERALRTAIGEGKNSFKLSLIRKLAASQTINQKAIARKTYSVFLICLFGIIIEISRWHSAANRSRVGIE